MEEFQAGACCISRYHAAIGAKWGRYWWLWHSSKRLNKIWNNFSSACSSNWWD